MTSNKIVSSLAIGSATVGGNYDSYAELDPPRGRRPHSGIWFQGVCRGYHHATTRGDSKNYAAVSVTCFQLSRHLLTAIAKANIRALQMEKITIPVC